jgi:hypothetical protein
MDAMLLNFMDFPDQNSPESPGDRILDPPPQLRLQPPSSSCCNNATTRLPAFGLEPNSPFDIFLDGDQAPSAA